MFSFCLHNEILKKTTRKKPSPKIGVLRIDYDYPPLVGDVDDENTFKFEIEYVVVNGLTFEKAQSGEINDSIIMELDIAIRKLEQKQVIGITGDCGFLMAYQKIIRKATKLPVFMSSLLLTPIISAAINNDDKIGILTANSDSLIQTLPRLLTECGVKNDVSQFYVIGCQNIDGFEAVAAGERVDFEKVNNGIQALVKENLAKNPNTKAFLMECTELPAYSDTIRYLTALPVFDVTDLISLFYSSCTDNPRFGINNWQ